MGLISQLLAWAIPVRLVVPILFIEKGSNVAIDIDQSVTNQKDKTLLDDRRLTKP